jgi:hypothetical protein
MISAEDRVRLTRRDRRAILAGEISNHDFAARRKAKVSHK